MNGQTKRLLLDSNVVIDFINNRINALPEANTRRAPSYFISVITEMEALANPMDTEDEREAVRNILSNLTIVPLNDAVKTIAVEIRRSGSPRPKLPDAIVAATAVAFNAALVTRDKKLLALQWPGLHTIGIS